jgi:hypothetical protein
VKDLYNENYKTLKKEIEENTRKLKNSHVCESAELILLNRYTTENNLRLNAIFIKIPKSFFTEEKSYS